ncbi:hypothetical protein WA026_020837 [Henosepilachna vigintioctopunctata]|uniref:Macro domain-containing protein n=1 Tax=Henosepilachna vigintioctopunctata TaxID=420089 RepID=A0AAW1TQL0_9CUCU
MNRGIASIFKKIFGRVKQLKSQNKSVVQVVHISNNTRRIYYLITKSLFYEKPKYQTVFETLLNLKNLCEENKETHLALPHLSCGLDKLYWPKIFAMIKYIFHKSQIQITIYSLPVKENKSQIYSVNEEELTFEYFKGFHQREVNIPKPKLVSTPISKIKTLILPMSCDYANSNEYLTYVKTYITNLPEKPKITDIMAKKTRTTIHFCSISQRIQ